MRRDKANKSASRETSPTILSGGVVRDVWRAYVSGVPRSLRMIDAVLAYVLWAGVVQFVYALAVGWFPFNAFLAGFLSCVSVFVLTVSLRMQVNHANVADPQNRWEKLTPQRAYADWLFCNLIVHMAIFNFIG